MSEPLTLAGYIRQRPKVDWRFPDEFGLCERNLDCRQLCILEIMKWQGERNPIPAFLNAFDCRTDGLLLRRSEPVLQNGWSAIRFPSLSTDQLRHLVRSVYDAEGYCLIYYNAFEVPFSAYYRKHDVVHWALLIEDDGTHVTVIDDTGDPAYFDGYIGRIPSDLFFPALQSAGGSGAAIVRRNDAGAAASMEVQFARLARTSVEQMLREGGLDRLAGFVAAVEALPDDELQASLDQLEFDIHYFRRLRKLWETAAGNGVIPKVCLDSRWIGALTEACNQWSYAMGVLMKWKRQPEKSYGSRLTGYLRQALEAERQLFDGLERLLEGRP